MPNIVLKDRNGTPIVYQGILTVSFNDENGKIVRYAYIEEEPTGTTAIIKDNQLILNGASIDESNNLSLENARIDEQGYLVLEKGSE